MSTHTAVSDVTAARAIDNATGTVLSVENVRASYDDQIALHGVSITVAPGECVAILGSNGAGKTTLMNSIAGTHRPIEGRITLDGHDISKLRANRVARSGVGYVPEGRGVFPELTVMDNLRLSVGRDMATTERIFAEFPPLKRCANQAAGTLSGGEQQMLSMAPAVVNDYRLLLIDELSLGLAPLIVAQLFEVLESIRSRGIAIVLVEQFAQRALGLADRAYVMRKGSIVFEGVADELAGDEDRLHELYMGGA